MTIVFATFLYQLNRTTMPSSNGNFFRVIDPLCGECTGHGWIPHAKASDAELWCFFDQRLNKRLSKQSWGWWFETQSLSLWRHFNVCKHILPYEDRNRPVATYIWLIRDNDITLWSFLKKITPYRPMSCCLIISPWAKMHVTSWQWDAFRITGPLWKESVTGGFPA